MKKAILVILAVTLMLSLAACLGNGTTTENTENNPAPTPTLIENSALHPFAAALVDFHETIDEDFYDCFRDMGDYTISHTSAYLIDLDGQGTTGVLAYRAVGDVDHFRVFYMHNGKVKTLDFLGLYFYLNEVGEAPLIKLSGGEGAGRLYEIYSLTLEGLVITSKLWDFLGNEFYYNNEAVSEDDFNSLLERYNINDSRFINFALKPHGGYRDEVINVKPDDTAKILVMTMGELTSLKEGRAVDNLVNAQADTARQEETYTVEQIQTALLPQFQVGDWGEGNPQVVSVQKVEMDRDSITLEGSGTSIDLSISSRYQVIIKYRQSLDDFNLWAEIYKDTENNPFRREGGYTIFTGFYYFNDVNGEPELAFVAC